MSEGTHVLIGVKTYTRFESGSPVRLVPGSVVTPTPQELAAFPDRFEPVEPQNPTITQSVKAETQDDTISDSVISGETSPVYDEFTGDPLGFVEGKTVDELVALVAQGEIPAKGIVETELARDNPRVTLGKRLAELTDG